MATLYLLGSNPIWYFVDLVGLPLGAGYFATYNAQNPSQLKPVFEDPDGLFPFPYVDIPNTDLQGILIDENGTLGPIYFANDVPYLLTWFDSNGVQIDQVDNFTPGGGGGGDITEGINLTNLIVNGVFWRSNINAPVSGAQDVFLAPSAHAGFCSSTVPGNQPDIRFIKSNVLATDFLTFIPFTQGLSTLGQDVTPPVFLRYNCTSPGTGETFKYVQFPLSVDIQSTSGQNITTTIWARSNSGAATITLQYQQFFGDGGVASTPVLSTGSNFTLSANWTQFKYSETLPSIAGQTLGACQNTAIYLQVQYPLSQTSSIDIVKPGAYLSPLQLSPIVDYLTNDQIDAVISAPRVGDVRIAMNAFQPYGWVICNDETIGNPSSNATTRANFDTFPLFDLLWTDFVGNQTLAPMFNSSGTRVSYGESSVADFAANNQLSLTKILGRALSSAGQPSSGGSGNNWPIGTAQGEENHTLSINEIPSHNHPGSFIGGSSSTNVGAFVIRSDTNNVNQAVTVAAQGGGAAHNTIQPTAYFNVFLKL
jgi:microcystin-dependent protein